MLQQLKFSLTKYRVHATDIRGIYAAPMEQHRFLLANTCEELLSAGLNMKGVTLFKKHLGWTFEETIR
jgi:hypothetical protein